MADPALHALKNTLSVLINSDRISLDSSSQEIVKSALVIIESLVYAFITFNESGRSSNERLDALEEQIRDCAEELEDVVECYVLQNDNYEGDLQEVKQAITSFTERAERMMDEYYEELSSPVRAEDNDDDASVSSYIDHGLEMVGHSDVFTKTKEYLQGKMRPDDMCFFAIVGEVGSGRTIAGKLIMQELYQSQEQSYFDLGALTSMSDRLSLKQVFISIITQLLTKDNLAADYNVFYNSWGEDENDKICDFLYKILEDRRYIIFLDDVGDVRAFNYLKRSFPDQSNGSLVLLTTNLQEVADAANSITTWYKRIPFHEEYSWFHLRMAIFGDSSISPDLEEAGRQIAKNCRGLYISLAKTLFFLYNSDKTLENWSRIAADRKNPIFMVEDERKEMETLNRHMESCNWDMANKSDELTFEYISSWRARIYHDPGTSFMSEMHPKRFFSKARIIPFIGMIGIGKSTLAKKIFKDESNLRYFDHVVWVNLGRKYKSEDILIDILAEIFQSTTKNDMKGNEKLQRKLCAKLSRKKCLVVLDDLCSRDPLDRLKQLFPDIKGTILVTSRLVEVLADEVKACVEMPLLNNEESWCLLRRKVFGEEFHRYEFEKVGRKIAENCDGLPLLILTVANQLCNDNMTVEFWENVASGKEKSIFKNAHDEISKRLLPSYKSLPHYLKTLFLYMGIFCEKKEIPTSKLINLLRGEGFFDIPNIDFVADLVAQHNFMELHKTSLLMVQRKVIDFMTKKCRLHSVCWHLSNSLAVKKRFFHALNSYADCSIESMKSPRRLCIRNGVLLSLKILRDSMASIKSTRSLVCVNPLQPYPVPINFDLRFLRVMEALAIRLYEFPVEVVKLVHLKYLALTCNGNLPTSISKLLNLKYLVVSRYIKTASSENSSSLPVEIWEMKELIHLQIMGGCLPNPRGAGLPKLLTLLDVSARSCTKNVLRGIPNLRKLGIRIELAPNGKGNPFDCLNIISRLCKVQSLKCVVVNPQIGNEVAAPPAPTSMFPSSLKKLSLSGFGYAWEYMNIIGKLENLELLKLRHYAFEGPNWITEYTSPFMKLKYLLVEDTNLVHWEIKTPIFKQLERLSIKSCYKLKEPPTMLPQGLKMIEIVDCNPSTLTWAERVRQELPLQVERHLSWIAHGHEE